MQNNEIQDKGRLTASDPWPGLRPYAIEEAAFFRGRDTKIRELHSLIVRAPMCVFYGRSGLGKTSLLQAGLVPELLKTGHMPVIVRLDHRGKGEAAELADQVKTAIAEAVASASVDAPLPEAAETLWGYFHRRELEFWDQRNRPLQPVLVLDQFEEIYTRGRESPEARSRSERFLSELEALADNRPGEADRRRFHENPELASRYDLDRQTMRLVLVLREDYLPLLLEDRRRFSPVSYHQCRIDRMSGVEAWEVLFPKDGDRLLDEATALRVLEIVSDRDHRYPDGTVGLERSGLEQIEIDPSLLSVVCRELNRARMTRGLAVIDSGLVEELHGSILEQFYESAFENLRPEVRRFVEDRLLSTSGEYRQAFPLEEAVESSMLTRKEIERLVDHRLLHVEDYHGHPHLELAHDRLTEVARASRQARIEKEQRETEQRRQAEIAATHRRRVRRARAVAAGLLLAVCGLLGGGTWYWWHKIREHEVHYVNITKSWGIMRGAGLKLTREQAARRAVSFRFLYRGSEERGRLRLVQAVDGMGRLTSQHELSNNLRVLEDLQDPGRECQWQFVIRTNEEEESFNEEVVYEMALNKWGEQVWGFVYSPGTGNVRRGHFVGPDGFPQLQNKTGADYIEIHFDPVTGFEAKHLYLSAFGEPRPGKDGAYGRVMEYSDSGFNTAMTSIDENGDPINDAAWNATLKVDYNESGRMIKARAFDMHGSPCLTSNLMSGYDMGYDQFGNLVTMRFVDIAGQATRSNEGIAGWQSKFDERGRETKRIYLDEKKKPCRHQDGTWGWEQTFNERGLVALCAYLGQDGTSWIRSEDDQVAGWQSEYDKRGRQTKLLYLDEKKKPCQHQDGTWGWDQTLNERGLITLFAYLGQDGTSWIRSEDDQVAGWQSEYDERGRETKRLYLDEKEEPCQHTDGSWGELREYDDRGLVTLFANLGEDGTSWIRAGDAKIAGERSEFDERGRMTKRIYLDEKKEPCQHTDGSWGELREYDDRGLVTLFANLGEDGTSWIRAGDAEIAGERNEFDERGRMTKRIYLDEKKEPCQHQDGSWGWVQVYNKDGLESIFAYLAEDGAGWVRTAAEGVAGWRSEYDERGRETRRIFLDEMGNPCQHKDDHWGMTLEYAETGDEAVRIRYHSGPNGPEVPSMITITMILPEESQSKISEHGGLQPGDIVWSYGSWSVMSPDPFRATSASEFMSLVNKPGKDPRTMQVIRNGKLLNFEIPRVPLGVIFKKKVIADARLLRELEAGGYSPLPPQSTR